MIALTFVYVNTAYKNSGGIAMLFHERLVFLRKSNSLTQKQLAIELQISELAVQHYESQRRKPAFDILLSIADYFHVSLDYLCGRTDNPEINK